MKIFKVKSIQSQLILYFTITIIIPAIITSIIGVKIINDQVIRQAENKVLSDLNSAREVYQNSIQNITNITRMTAVRSLIIKALENKDINFLRQDFNKILKREKLDILTILDEYGNVVYRGSNPDIFGDNLKSNPLIKNCLTRKQIISGTVITPADELKKDSPELAERAIMKIIPTPKAKQRTDTLETAGMFLKTAVPIFNESGQFIGILLGGVMINRNYEIVDKIKKLMYEQSTYKGKELSTATIFMKDLRISTNVKNEDGSRAIATLVSEDVFNTVIENGERWIGDAFVVNTWYIGAYEPIRDINGEIVGILYVGTLKLPFDDLLRNSLLTFLGIALIGIVMVIFVSYRLSKKISAPLRKLETIADELAYGNYNLDFQCNGPREIEHLASSFKNMAQELQKEKLELEEWAMTLEKKVQERTDEIKNIHAQLFRSEKLASLGKLAAGVAHEINNPLTGILTNASLILEDLEPNDPKREDVEIIVKETIRCREIVKRLLDFAKQTQPQKKLININSLIENIILLVRNQASFRNIQIEKYLDTNIPEIMVDPDQIQQVFINIIINAAEAMGKGGKLLIETKRDKSGNNITIVFKDTGPGIPEHLREKIFDPFFTTKESGTGLGLSISHGIIEQHGGTIDLDSKINEGTTFMINIPIKQQ
ncbi:MAG: sensor histidine kinase [Ignavibacteriae bacterium]|nr:MAG: sensor histidine kinase [Ignavibacteriota bacterium]